AFAVLRLLHEQAGQLVTKEALLEAIWPDAVVSEAALTVCIGELRKALRETAQAPRFIQTVHRRGARLFRPPPPARPPPPPLAPWPPAPQLRSRRPRRCWSAGRGSWRTCINASDGSGRAPGRPCCSPGSPG